MISAEGQRRSSKDAIQASCARFRFRASDYPRSMREDLTFERRRRNVEASLFLSTRPVVPDQRGRRLRLEAAQLAADVAAGRLLARPCSGRDNDDWDRRIEVLYGFTDPRAFTSARKERDARE